MNKIPEYFHLCGHTAPLNIARPNFFFASNEIENRGGGLRYSGTVVISRHERSGPFPPHLARTEFKACIQTWLTCRVCIRNYLDNEREDHIALGVYALIDFVVRQRGKQG